MAELAANGAQSTLATPPSGTTGTSLVIQTADTGKFPATGDFACLLQDSLTAPTQFEIVEVTGVSGATYTVTRASEPYAGAQTAQTWSAGAYITQVATPGTVGRVATALSVAGDLVVGGMNGVPTRAALGAAAMLLQPVYGSGDPAAVFASGQYVSTPLQPANLTAFSIVALLDDTGGGAPVLSVGSAAGAGPYLATGRPGGGYYPGTFWVNSAHSVEVGQIFGPPSVSGIYDMVGVWSGASGAVVEAVQFSLYVAGAAVAVNAGYSTAAPTAPVSAGAPLYIAGNMAGGANAYVGAISRVAFFPYALTAAQVSNLHAAYASGVAATYDNAILALSPSAYWKLNETSGTTAADSSGNGQTGTYSSGVTLGGTTVPLTPPPTVKWVGSPATSPPAASSVALTSGTAYQNTTGADVLVAVPIAYAATSTAAATCLVQRGSASPGTTVGTISRAAASLATTDVSEFYLPSGWYLTLTLTNATFAANATVQQV